MTFDEAMAELEALGSEKVRAMNARNGSDENQFGVKMGDIRNLANKIKSDPELARQLWTTGNLDARFLATLIMKPKALSSEEVEALVRTVKFDYLADWLNTNVVKQHQQK